MRIVSTEDRAEQMMNEQIDALVDVELGRVGDQRFFPENLARRVTTAYSLPGKDDASDPRVKLIAVAYIKARVIRAIRKSRNGLRLHIPIGGSQWQYAPATTARHVRVFRNNYQELEQSAGARRERLDQVLDAHAAQGLDDSDLIRTAYEAALEGEPTKAEAIAA